MSKFDTIEQLIVENLSELSATLLHTPAKQGSWTRLVIGRLANVGKANHFTPCAHGCDDAEFLFDLVWTTRDAERSIIDVQLVAESEWGTEAYVEADFCKLMLARTSNRLMIFDGDNVHGVEPLIGRLSENARKFARSQKGDRYLFAFWRDTNFQFESLVV